jgi:hypothetical protein
MLKRVVLVILGTLVIALTAGGVAMAGHTPLEIYNDFLADGHLDGTYTTAELKAYLNDSQLHEYYDTSVTDRLDDAVRELVTRETFPFTGFQLLMAGIAVVVLIGGGIALRRLSRPQKSSQKP